MAAEEVMGPPRIRRKLADLSHRPLNFDLRALDDADPASGWVTTDLRQPLPGEAPGAPVRDGSWEIARRLMRGYEFADPSIVRAYYDPAVPLQGRNMLLKLRALGLVHLFVGVRVGEVYERTLTRSGWQARVWGWNYRTLEGHVEMGQMDWEVWKWLDSGQVDFRVHAVSRPAPIANPVIWLGFALLKGHERAVFLQSTKRRMRTFVEIALNGDQGGEPIRQAAAALTARPTRRKQAAQDELVRNVRDAAR